MTVIHEWTTKLAEAIAPEEAYLASSFADAYEANLQWANQAQASEGSSSSPEDIANNCQPCDMGLLLPSVIDGVATSSHHLIHWLTSDETQSLVNVMSPFLPFIYSSITHKSSHAEQAVNIEELHLNLGDDHPLSQDAVTTLVQNFEGLGMHRKDAMTAAIQTLWTFLNSKKESGLNFLNKIKR